VAELYIDRLDLRVDPARVAAMGDAELVAAIHRQLPQAVRNTGAAADLAAQLAREVRAGSRRWQQ
jgi:hypothetical protein